jgi:hypothetical protein
MCWKIVSSFTVCKHEDNVKHIRICSDMLELSLEDGYGSTKCPQLGFDYETNDMEGYCPRCQVLNLELVSGRLVPKTVEKDPKKKKVPDLLIVPKHKKDKDTVSDPGLEKRNYLT